MTVWIKSYSGGTLVPPVPPPPTYNVTLGTYAISMDEDGDYLYLGSNSFYNPMTVKVFLKLDGSAVATINIPVGSGSYVGDIKHDATYIYASVTPTKNRIVRILKATWTVVDFIDSPTFSNFGAALNSGVQIAVDVANSRLYVPDSDLATGRETLWVIDTVTFTTFASVPMTLIPPPATAVGSGIAGGVSLDTNFIYLSVALADATSNFGLTQEPPPMLYKIDKATLTVQDAAISPQIGLSVMSTSAVNNSGNVYGFANSGSQLVVAPKANLNTYVLVTLVGAPSEGMKPDLLIDSTYLYYYDQFSGLLSRVLLSDLTMETVLYINALHTSGQFVFDAVSFYFNYFSLPSNSHIDRFTR